jgi:hypothetical protein
MPRETVTIELSKLPPYQAAARLLAVITYPDSTSECEHFADAIVIWFLQQRALADHDWARVPFPIEPRLLTVHDVDGTLKRGLRILNRQRLIAAKQAAPRLDWFWQFATTGRKPQWEKVDPTGEAMIDAIDKDLKQPKRLETRGRKAKKGDVVEKSNVIRLAWTPPSRSVLHLCWALHRTIPGEDLMLGDFLSSVDARAVLGIIHAAEAASHLLCGQFEIAESEWIAVVAA